MQVQIQPRAFDEIVDFITSSPRPEAILVFKPTEKAVARIEVLLEKKRVNDLSDTERQELEQFLLIEHLMRVAKARARKKLAEA